MPARRHLSFARQLALIGLSLAVPLLTLLGLLVYFFAINCSCDGKASLTCAVCLAPGEDAAPRPRITSSAAAIEQLGVLAVHPPRPSAGEADWLRSVESAKLYDGPDEEGLTRASRALDTSSEPAGHAIRTLSTPTPDDPMLPHSDVPAVSEDVRPATGVPAAPGAVARPGSPPSFSPGDQEYMGKTEPDVTVSTPRRSTHETAAGTVSPSTAEPGRERLPGSSGSSDMNIGAASLEGSAGSAWLLFGIGAAMLFLASAGSAIWLGSRLSSDLDELLLRARKVGHGEMIPSRKFLTSEFDQIHEALTMTAGERWRGEERLEVLIQELQHRTNNLLAVVSSIARHTLVQGRPVAESRDLFLGRLHALANASATLARTNWRGAEMAMVIKNELEPFSERVSISGPSVLLSAQVAQNVSLMIHELVTNARKHGALSNDAGAVTISWQVSGQDKERQLEFEWVERGGPPTTPPQRRGFGYTLLRTTLAGTGLPKLTFETQGFAYRMTLPLEMALPEAA